MNKIGLWVRRNGFAKFSVFVWVKRFGCAIHFKTNGGKVLMVTTMQ